MGDVPNIDALFCPVWSKPKAKPARPATWSGHAEAATTIREALACCEGWSLPSSEYLERALGHLTSTTPYPAAGAILELHQGMRRLYTLPGPADRIGARILFATLRRVSSVLREAMQPWERAPAPITLPAPFKKMTLARSETPAAGKSDPHQVRRFTHYI